MRHLLRFLILLPLFLFFLATSPGNRTETDMGFEHALRVEQGVGAADPYFPLYVPLLRALYLPLRAAGLAGRAYPMMKAVSALCAAATVLLFFLFCFRRFSLRPLSSLFATGFLMFSYGFWRYSTEAESVVPASFFALAAFYQASVPGAGARRWLAAGALGAVAAGLHALSLAPTLVMIPLYLLCARRGRATGWYLAGFLAVLLAVLAAFGLVRQYRPGQLFAPGDPAAPTSLSIPVKGAIGLAQTVVSGHFLLRYPSFRQALAARFPYRMLGEEFYLGERLTRMESTVPTLTLAALAAALALATLGALRARRAPHPPRPAGGLAPGGRAAVTGAAIWMGVQALLAFVQQPGSPNTWIPMLIPLWLVFCAVIIAPMARMNRLWIVLLLFGLFAAHNHWGGMRPLRDAARDYNARKAEWLLSTAVAEDRILTAENPVFVRYLRYHTRARVADLNTMPLSEALADAGPGRIYVLPDVLDYPHSMAVRFPQNKPRVAEAAAALSGRLEPVAETEFGRIWRVAGEGDREEESKQ